MSSEKHLLIEQIANPRFIVESTDSNKSMTINGIFMQAAVQNRNRRTYPLHEITSAVKHANDLIERDNGIFGELDHPNTLTINSRNISHVITELHMRGNDAYGKAKLLNTPSGLIAQELFSSGVKVGVSSRGAGELNEGVVSNFQFITIDVVVNPSAAGATPEAIMESVEHASNSAAILTLAEASQHDETAQKYLKNEIMRWLRTNALAKR